MALGRPKEFDREEALEQAMEVFWTFGYEATGVRDLVAQMEIGRQSLYDTFGDKRNLFLETVDHYRRTVTEDLVEILDGPGSPLANIRKLFDEWRHMAATGEPRGCLIGNTAVELASRDEEIARAVRSVLGRLEKALQRTLERAVAAGELAPDTETRSLATFRTSTGQGLIVLGKAGVGRAKLRNVARVALSILEDSASTRAG